MTKEAIREILNDLVVKIQGNPYVSMRAKELEDQATDKLWEMIEEEIKTWKEINKDSIDQIIKYKSALEKIASLIPCYGEEAGTMREIAQQALLETK